MAIPITSVLAAQVVIQGTQVAAGSSVAPAINVFNFRRLAIVVNPTKAALSAAFQLAILVPLLAASNIRYTPNRLSIRWLNDATDPFEDFVAPGVGAIATDSEPSSDAVYVYLKTAVRMRGGKGGKHFAGTSEADTTGDILVGAGLARWQAVRNACAAQIVDLTPNTWQPIVLSTTFSQLTLNPTIVVADDVTQALLDLNIGTMRRRRTRTVR